MGQSDGWSEPLAHAAPAYPGRVNSDQPSPSAPRFVPEDAKLATLARSARVRNSADTGAAVRDTTGRTYVATGTDLPSLRLTALQVAVAMAVASGAEGLEAAVVVTGETEPVGPESAANSWAESVAAVRDLAGTGVPVHFATPDGIVRTSTLS